MAYESALAFAEGPTLDERIDALVNNCKCQKEKGGVTIECKNVPYPKCDNCVVTLNNKTCDDLGLKTGDKIDPTKRVEEPLIPANKGPSGIEQECKLRHEVLHGCQDQSKPGCTREEESYYLEFMCLKKHFDEYCTKNPQKLSPQECADLAQLAVSTRIATAWHICNCKPLNGQDRDERCAACTNACVSQGFTEMRKLYPNTPPTDAQIRAVVEHNCVGLLELYCTKGPYFPTQTAPEQPDTPTLD